MAQNPFLSSPYDQLNDSESKYALPGINQEQTDARKPSASDNYLPPAEYRPVFETAAKEYNVPVNVLMALGHQESRYNANAIGQPTQWGRAKGMMQYLDSTAKGMGINPLDPFEAIPAAAKQIRERLDKGYSMEDAVKEHFAGPDRKLWGEKTKAYGQEVMAKVGKIGELIGASTPAQASTSNVIDDMNKDEPGRYRALTQDELASLEGQQQAANRSLFRASENEDAERIKAGPTSLGGTLFESLKSGSMNVGANIAYAPEAVLKSVDGVLGSLDKVGKEIGLPEWMLERKYVGPNDIIAPLIQGKDFGSYRMAGSSDFARMIQKAGKAIESPAHAAAIKSVAMRADSAVKNAIGSGDFSGVVDVLSDPESWAVAFGQAAPSLAVAVVGGLPAMVAMEGGGALSDLKEFEKKNGKVGDIPAANAIIQTAAVNSLLEKLGLDAAMGRLPQKVRDKLLGATTDGLKGRLLRGASYGAIGAAGESSTEMMQTVNENLSKRNYKADQPLTEGVLLSGMGGAASGGPVGGIKGAMTDSQSLAAQVRRAIDSSVNNTSWNKDRINQDVVDSMRPTQPVRQAQAAAAENNIPNIVIEGTEDGQQVATVTPAQPSKAAGPLTRAIENAADQPARVTVTAPEGQITGFLQSTSEDSQGNTLTRVLGDDGQVYNFTSADGVQIKPEAGPLTKAVEQAAAQTPVLAPEAAQTAEIPPVEQKQQVTDATLTNEGTKPAEATPTEPIDVTGRTDQQLSYLAQNGQPGWKEAAQAELAKRGISQEPAAPKGQFKTADEAQAYIQAQRRRAGSKLPKALPLPHEDGSFGVVTDGQSGWEQAVAYAKANAPKTEKESRERRSSNVKKSYDVWDEDGNKGTINIVRSKDGSLFRIFQIWTNQDGKTAQFEQSTGYGEGITDDYIVKAIAEPGDLLLTNPNDKPKTEKEAKAPEPTLETMTEPELRDRLKYIANQAKSAGGWNKMLMAERRKVEAQINKFAQAIKQETTNDQRNASDLPVRDDQPAVALVAAAQPADQQGAGAGSTETTGAGAAVPGEPVPGAGANVSGADSAADAKPALKKATKEDLDHLFGKDKDEHAGKRFGSREKADAYIAKKKIAGTHAVEQTGKVRFEVKPKADQAAAAPKYKFSRGDLVQFPMDADGNTQIGEIASVNGDKLTVFMDSGAKTTISRKGAVPVNKVTGKPITTQQEQTNGAETQEAVAAEQGQQAEVPVSGAGVTKPAKREFTYKVKPTEGGFLVESDDGGGVVMAGRPNGPGVMNTVPAKVFKTEAAAREYMRKKGMAEAKSDHDKGMEQLAAKWKEDDAAAEKQDTHRVSLNGKAAGDVINAEDGTLYRIEGIDVGLGKIRLTRNPNMLSERVALVDQDRFDRLVAEDEAVRAEAMKGAVAIEIDPAAIGKKAEPEKAASDDGLEKLAAGYGYQGGIDTMPAGLAATARKLHAAMTERDVAKAQEILHPDNKRSREAFEKMSGVKLPKTVGGTETAVAEYLAKKPAADKDGNTIVGRRSDGVMIRQDKNGVRFYFDSGVRISEPVSMRPTRAGVVMERGELKPDFMTAEEAAEAAPKAKPAVTENKVFTEDAAEKARALLKSKLNQFNTGIDPEVMQAGITPAGYHIEKGARTFAAYSKAMIDDLGDVVKPYLKSWYMGVKYDPRAASFDGMDSAADVEAASIDNAPTAASKIRKTGKIEKAPDAAILNTQGVKNADTTTTAGSAGNRALEGAPAAEVRSAQEGRDAEQRGAEGGRTDFGTAGNADRAGDTGGSSLGDGTRDVSVPARGRGGKRGSAGQRRVQAELGIEQADARSVTEQRDAEVATARQEQKAAGDYRITDLTRLGEGGQKTKYKNNVAAIRLLNDLQQTGRLATPDEQDVLARYVGWGGIAQAFDPDNKEWSAEYAELKSVLTDEEWEASKESTQYAHYTSQEIIEGMWDAARHMGFTGGNILEPGSGVGNFIGLMPEDLRSASRFTAVERERIAGGIAKQLYPNQNVQQQDFRKFNAQDGYYDLVAGNPPFSSTTLTDLSGRKHLSGLSIHNYFFAKSIDMLGEGKILMQVVSNSFLDAKGDKARRYIGERTEFLGAIRLPNKAFAKNANTEVTTDIVFLKKRPESEWGSKAAKDDMQRWQGLGSVPDPLGGDPIPLNQYFVDHPEMMLGRMERAGSMYGPGQPALIAREGQDTKALMKQAILRLPKDVYVATTKITNEAMQTAEVVALDNAATVDVGGHYVKDGSVFVRMADVAGEGRAMQLTATTKISEKRELGANGLDRIKQLAEMRVTVRGLIAAEIKDADNIEALRAKLNEQYDAYVKKNGYINGRGTVQLFGDDPDFPLLASLENNYDPGIGAAAAKNQGIKPVPASAKKATIFSQRVIEKHEEVTSADTPEDALMVSIAERGQIDAGYIGQLLGKDGTEVLEGLTKGDNPALFVDPATNGYVLADEYLSGNVRKKLSQAKAAGMYGNVAALEKVIPEDIPSHEISGKIGAPWVSTDVYQDFATEIMGEGTKARVVYVPAMSSYVANFEAGSEVANKNTFGTARMGADEIYAALLNSKEIRVGHYEEDPQTRSRRFVLEKDATDEANDKAREIKDKFNDWLFSDADRAEKMQRAYNDAVNNYVTREFDGSMLKFPGKVPDVIIKLRRHQRNAVARIIQDGRALLDHVVGAGKTFTVIAAAMELKRTGLAKKPMIVVPNHLVKQWAADFYRLYPGANILTATKTDFSKANRRKFLAKIATGNWDAVIIAHSSYGFIKPDAEFEARFNKERIDEIVDAIKALKDEKDQTSKRTVKQLAKMQENLENKLASLRDRPMDDLLDFGQLGSDQLFVDEAHLFKNLMFVTKMQNVRGLGQPKGSQRAYDMFIKTHQIYEKNGNGRGVVFATGTPVSNSLAEMYHMLRYLAPETLKDSGQFTFDAWAKTFADVEQVWMQSMSGDGYKSSNRMSRFVNTPELLRVYDQVADTVTIDDIKQAFSEENNGAEFPIPKQKGGRRTPVSIPRSQAQTEYMDEIAKRAKALEQRKGKPQKGDDNMLSIMGDARKSAMDIRMVRFDITERDQNGRIAIAANNIFDRYQKYNDVRGTQLVFSDMGTPKKHAEKELKEYNELMAEVAPLSDDKVLAMAELGDESAQDQIEKAEEAQRKVEAKGQDWLDAIQAAMRGFSIYDDLKDALMEKGIPENEIAFIHDYNTDDQKAALFRAVNDGKVRVLLGSTEKMGAGTNVQERAVALHHLDVPWKPSDIEQREGRVIRQGNRLLNEVPNFEVEVMAYATQDTLDLFMWQTQEKKLSMIGQLRTGNVGREVDNAFEEMQMSAGEMQAAATSNPYLLEEIQLKDKVKKLERQKRSFEGQKNDLINRVRRAEKEVESIPPQIKDAQTVETAARKLVSHKDAHFNGLTATVTGETITGSDAIRQAIRNAVEASPMVTKDGKEARSVSIEFNGKEYTSESGVAEAANKALGDAAKITYTLPNGTTVYRGADVVAGLIDPIADLIETDGEAKLGKMGAFDVTAYGAGEGRFDVMVTLNGTDVGDFQIRTELKEPGALSARIRSIPTEVTRIIQSSIGLPAFLKSKLEKAKRTLADIEGKQDAGVWSGEDELKKARESYRAILKKLSETAEEQPEDEGAKFSVAAMRDETELEAIFADLEKRGLARNRAERMLNSDPDQAIIRYVDQNFFDILEELDDSKKVEIRC